MSSATIDPPDAPHALFAQSFRRVVFTIHGYSGRRQSRAVEATVNGQAVDAGRASKPRLALLPQDLDKKVAHAKGAIVDVLNRHTLSCEVADGLKGTGRGTRLVPVKTAAAFVAALEAAIAAYEAVADEVVAHYDAILRHNRDYWVGQKHLTEDQYAQDILPLIPPRERLRSRFGVTYRLAEGQAVEAGDAEAQAFFDAAHRGAVQHEAALVKAAAETPPRALAAALRDFKAKLKDGKKLTPGSATDCLAAADLCLAMEEIVAESVRDAAAAARAAIAGAVDAAEAEFASGGTYTAAFKVRATKLTRAIDEALDVLADGGAAAAMLEKFRAAPALDFDDDLIDDEEE